ncbi:MAG: HIT domain-containing protein [Candidatus Atribacteria bacterium]|nr:HIT domain-containing protein [Candidatus Atribacteria bacterium]
MRKNIFVPSKGEYVRGNRPAVDCILCSIVKNDPKVINLEIFRTKSFIIAVNLYPYNPGHLIIFPHRHIEEIEKLSLSGIRELHKLTVISLKVLKNLYNPHGFNIGYNLGKGSGASIKHLHLHIVPRYENELSFIDVLSGSKIIVEEPKNTLQRLKSEYKKYAKELLDQ